MHVAGCVCVSGQSTRQGPLCGLSLIRKSASSGRSLSGANDTLGKGQPGETVVAQGTKWQEPEH